MTDRVVNTHCPGIPCIDTAGFGLCVVLVQGGRGEYAAFQGIVPLVTYEKRAELAERVAALGAKLTHKQCVVHFPLIKAEEYRN